MIERSSQEIPRLEKSYFKLSEMSDLTGVKPYVLRYWETEFDEITPITSDSGHKLFSLEDVDVIMKIKHLLFEEKLSIEKARERLKNPTEPPRNLLKGQMLQEARSVLKESLDLIRHHLAD